MEIKRTFKDLPGVAGGNAGSSNNSIQEILTALGIKCLTTQEPGVTICSRRQSKAIEEEVKDISLKMKKEYENQYLFRALLIKRYFRIFLILLRRQLEESVENIGQTRETELVKRFMEMLDKNFREKKMVSSYAAQLYVNANYLNRIVKKNTGYSAGHHIRQRVVLEAKRMARYSDSGMKNIAYELGFLDSVHFSRFFKTFGGKNFSEFKRGALVVPLNSGMQRA